MGTCASSRFKAVCGLFSNRQGVGLDCLTIFLWQYNYCSLLTTVDFFVALGPESGLFKKDAALFKGANGQAWVQVCLGNSPLQALDEGYFLPEKVLVNFL